MRLPLTAAIVLAVAVAAGCSDPAKRAQQQLEELQKKKDAEKKAQQEREEKLRSPTLSAAWVALPPPYDEAGNTPIVPDGKCPQELWALFPDGPVPGATPEEKKANAAKRKEFEEMVRGRQYMVKLRSGDVKLNPYDAPAGRFVIDVVGTVDCVDSIGHIAVAWGDAKAVDPGNSAAKEGAEVTQNVWQSPPVAFPLPMTSQTQAKEFFDKNRFGLSARVVFTLGKTEIDKKLKKIAKVSDKPDLVPGLELGYGGGVEDWGAGRMVRAELVGLRVATEQDKKQLFDERGKK